MDALVTVGFLIHWYLTIDVVLGAAGTTNPIWGELRAATSALPVVALWGLLQGAVT